MDAFVLLTWRTFRICSHVAVEMHADLATNCHGFAVLTSTAVAQPWSIWTEEEIVTVIIGNNLSDLV